MNKPSLLEESSLTIEQIDNTYQLVDNIIDGLDDESLIELMGGYDSDIDSIMGSLIEESNKVLNFQGGSITTSTFGYLDHFTDSVEESFRVNSLSYFIQSVLPDFEMNWHHLEWGQMVQMYRLLCIIAARDHSKSFFYSKAYPLWKLYRYKKFDPIMDQSKDRALCEFGVLFSNEISLAEELLSFIKDEIEGNEALHDKLYPGKTSGWAKQSIRCANGARMLVKSAGSKARGLHPGWIVVDDYLNDQALYSATQRSKNINHFHSVIMNMIVPNGQVAVVGCVSPSTWVLSEGGLRRIGDLCPGDINSEKTLLDYNKPIFGKNGFKNASKYWVNGKVDTNVIHLRNGVKMECSEIHPLYVMKPNGKPTWIKSSDLKEGDYVGVKLASGFGNASKIDLTDFRNDVDSKVRYRNKMIIPDYLDSDLSYLIGLWVAEGSYEKSGRVNISNTEDCAKDFLLSKPYGLDFKQNPHEGSRQTFRASSKTFLELLEYIGTPMGTAIDKGIPSRIMGSDENTIIPFLQGLYDGDGHNSVSEKQIVLGSISESLIRDTQTLLLHLGIDSTVFSRPIPKPTKRAIGRHNTWICRCTGVDYDLFLDIIGFRFPRKNIGLDTDRLSDRSRKIPHQGKLVKLIRESNKGNNKGICDIGSNVSSFCGNITGHVGTLRKIFSFFKDKGVSSSEMDTVSNNLNENLLWIPIKSIEKDFGNTVDFVIPDGHNFISNGIVSHNTPFHQEDLYGDLKKKLGWRVFEYPAIFPDGSLLWENRHNMRSLLEKRSTQGPLIFSREILVKPVTDDSAIFTRAIIEKAFVGMEDYKLVNNRSSFPNNIKFKRVVTGCDFARSANVGADFSCFITLGIDYQDRMWVINVFRGKGLSYNKQLLEIKKIHANFRPDVIYMEENQMQALFVDGAKEMGLPVEGHHTGGNKKSLYEGLPALAVLMEQGKFRFPKGDHRSKETMEQVAGELQSIAFIEDTGKLESTDQHDDSAMALWIASRAAYNANTGFNFSFI